MSESAEKIYYYEDIKRHKIRIENKKEEALERFNELSRMMRELIDETSTNSQISQYEKRIMELEGENEKMKNRLKKSFPTHIVIYLAVCGFIMGMSIILLFLRFVCKIYIVDPYYIICALLISLTLFATAGVAIKDWKCFLNE